MNKIKRLVFFISETTGLIFAPFRIFDNVLHYEHQPSFHLRYIFDNLVNCIR